MVDKLEIIEELNTLIETLILHGGDDGGPYFTEPYAVKTQSERFIKKESLSNYKEWSRGRLARR